METMERKKTRTRRSFTPEFKAEIVELCRRGDRSVGQVSRDFDLTETAVRAWVRQAEVDGGARDGLTTEERQELSRLRREVRSLKEDVEVLKRATVFMQRPRLCRTRRRSRISTQLMASWSLGALGIITAPRGRRAACRPVDSDGPEPAREQSVREPVP